VRFESAFGKGAWLRVVMREGRKRQIREVGARLGLPIVRIIRTRISTLHLGSLKPREWRYLTPEEIAALKGQPRKTRPRPEKAGSESSKSSELNRPRRALKKDRR
jgi:23S rRNA pseudouridine2605 synthase